MKRRSLLFTSFLVTATFVLISCGGESESEQNQEDLQGERAPNFEVTTVDGQTISLQESLDNDMPMVVYFTASWCPTCARNWPALSEVYPEFEGRLTLVAISIDPTDTEDVIRELAEERGFTFPSTAGKPNLMTEFNVTGQATTVGVDRDGIIAFKRPGEAISADGYRELFESLVN